MVSQLDELIVGILLLLIGIILTLLWLDEVVVVFKGMVPIIFLLLGGLVLWVYYEDRKISKELERIKAEFAKEEEKK